MFYGEANGIAILGNNVTKFAKFAWRITIALLKRRFGCSWLTNYGRRPLAFQEGALGTKASDSALQYQLLRLTMKMGKQMRR